LHPRPKKPIGLEYWPPFISEPLPDRRTLHICHVGQKPSQVYRSEDELVEADTSEDGCLGFVDEGDAVREQAVPERCDGAEEGWSETC
jgi:hypothetical protein